MENGERKRNIEVQQQERFERVQISKWNERYREISVLGVPRYLREKGKEGRMIRMGQDSDWSMR